ncbi:hypothetical protein ACWNT8_15490 (plasmid) [Pigmentibacter ruber]
METKESNDDKNYFENLIKKYNINPLLFHKVVNAFPEFIEAINLSDDQARIWAEKQQYSKALRFFLKSRFPFDWQNIVNKIINKNNEPLLGNKGEIQVDIFTDNDKLS